MRRPIFFLAVLITLCLLAACGPQGLAFYLYGTPWETDGNTICMDSAAWIDHFTLPDGTVLTAEEGGKLVKVTCQVKLAEGWRIASDTELTVPYPGTNSKLLCEPVFVGSSDRFDTYILLFSLTSANAANVSEGYRWELERYGMTLCLEQSDTVRRTQGFAFMN
ncbi:MAG: hypothetical protein E7436_07160 [Ruminococcaceae bacterium]|nr:hypothetical protein [Oscillospiraceae bacterium]